MGTEQPRLAMISLYLPGGSKIGSGYQAHGMANAFAARGWEVTMYSPCDRPEDAHYDHVKVDTGNSLRTFRFAWELTKVRWSKYDVVHAHGDDYLLWFRSPVHIRTMHGSCLMEAVHIKGIKERLRMLLLGISEALACGAAHCTAAVSTNTVKSYPWIRKVIPNGVDLEKFKPGGEKAPDPTILFVGTYKNRKRGALLMDVFQREILPDIPKAKLWMVCNDAPEAPGVTVFGRVTEDHLAQLYREAWVFCLPSSYEGFGVPYIEAMASGTSVAATPNPGSIEVLDSGHYGRLVEPESLGTALKELLQNTELRNQLESAGLARADFYSWRRITEQYEVLYSQCSGVRRLNFNPVTAT